MIANSAVYRDGARLSTGLAADDLAGMRDAVRSGQAGDFVSIGLHEPDASEMAEVAKVFGLHKLAVEDAVHPAQRPKLERYGDMVFLVLKTLWFVDKTDSIASGQVALFLGPDYVVTVRQGADFELKSIPEDLEGHEEVLKEGPAAVVYAVCDRVVDVYEDVVTNLESDVDAVEAAVFEGRQTHASDRIYQLNRELTKMRRFIDPLKSPMQQLASADVHGVTATEAPFFRDVGDHLARVSDALDALDNVLSSAFDANLSRIGVQQNDDMRKMSAWAGIAAVVTVFAGIYGMNFTNMPELRWSFGYPLALAVMIGSGMILHRQFKKSGWL